MSAGNKRYVARSSGPQSVRKISLYRPTPREPKRVWLLPAGMRLATGHLSRLGGLCRRRAGSGAGDLGDCGNRGVNVLLGREMAEAEAESSARQRAKRGMHARGAVQP